VSSSPQEPRGARPSPRFDASAARAVLSRLLDKGPLDKWPKRRGDLDLLLALACSAFERRRAYREDEVNERIAAWLDRFTAPESLDYVTIRRLMIDARWLLRDSAGAAYRLNPAKEASMPPVASPLDPGAVLIERAQQRDRRKRERDGAES